jgi:small ligand-binding sensory domain FIST
MRWASAIATDAHLEDAVGNAADEVLAALDGAPAELVLAFVTDHHAGRFSRLAAEIRHRLPGALLLGCSAGGAIGGGIEVEHHPAVSLTAASLPGVRITPFRVGEAPRAWPAQIDVAEGADAAFVLLPCPLTCPVEVLLDWMDERWPGVPKVGGLASGGMTADGPSRNTLFLADDRVTGGAIGIALEGDVQVDTIVAQGCRPIGEPLIVTRAVQNVAVTLDGQPALDVLERIVAMLSPDEQRLARHSLFLGVAMKGGGPLGRGDFLTRNVLGIDPDSGAVAAGAPLTPGQIVQFQLRDGAAADDDLRDLLSRHDGAPPEGALLFSCVGRGQLMYGVPDHDSKLFRRIVGDVPLGGFFGNGEVGPVHRRTFLHMYTSAFALFRRRHVLA